MLVVDDTRINLLKMKEKLLKVTRGDRQELLEDYKKMALSIDKEEYDALIDEIRDKKYINLPLYEQIIFLNRIIDEYNSLNELQYRFRNVYDDYTNEELELSDLSKIFIDNIIERSSVIQGYLMNGKNLESNKEELDKLNLDLINALKKQSLVDNKVAEINNNLKLNLLSSEGRIIQGNEMVYTSAVQEYKNIGLDLRKLIDDSVTRKDELSNAIKVKNDNNETLAAASICYRDNSNNQDIYNKIKEDVKKSEYVVTMLEIVNEICTETNEYNLMINKLYRLLNLIEERKLYLKSKFYIDPFDRIKINEQLEILNSLNDNTESIAKIKKTITYFTDNISNAETMNKEYLKRINDNEQLLSEDLLKELEPEIIDEVNNEEIVPESEENNLDNGIIYSDNQVKSIREISDDFKLDIVRDKTNAVINRVNELMSGNNESSKVPELIIENVSQEETNELPAYSPSDNETIDNTVLESTSVEDDVKVDETLPIYSVFDNNPVDNNIFEDNNNEEAKIEETLPGNLVFENEPVGDNIFEDNPNTLNVFDDKQISNDNDLFQEVKPFDEAPLFTEKYEDIFDVNKNAFEGNIDKPVEVPFAENTALNDAVNEMPDAFWVTREEPVIDTEPKENVVSFDDQINMLINNSNDSKTMKKVV